MSGTVVISGRSVGSRRPIFADWSLPLPPDDFGDDGLTLRDMISRIVAEEVRAYEQRREVRKLDRVFSAREIEEGEKHGRIAPEARESAAPPPLEVAIGTALQAFEDGLYLVIVDEVEQRELDRRVFLKPNSRVTFVRLTFLAGA